jgi:hypothetical protein
LPSSDRPRSISSSLTVSRGGYAEDAAQGRQLYDVHAQPERHAFARDAIAEFIVRRTALAILNDLHAEQQSASANIADALVTLLQRSQTVAKALADLDRTRYKSIALDDLKHLQPDRGRSGSDT